MSVDLPLHSELVSEGGRGVELLSESSLFRPHSTFVLMIIVLLGC